MTMARSGRSLAQALSFLSKRCAPAPSPRPHAHGVVRTLGTGSPTSWPPEIESPDEAKSAVDGDGDGDGDGLRKVAVFWDLDNKPPRNVPPFDAAERLLAMAAGFGEVVDVAAYANRFAFSYLPLWVKEQRRERRHLDRLERAGIVQPSEPYVCGYCGRKCKTNEKLKKHFRDLHERERNKRMNRLHSLKGGKRDRFRAGLSEKEERYRSAAREVIVPKVGYGLAGELRRAGVYVRMVGDKSQAADEALKLHMHRSIKAGIDCLCLVSDDSGFANILRLAQSRHLHTVVVGDTSSLTNFADDQFSWREVAAGSALPSASELHGQWAFEEDCFEEPLDLRDAPTMGFRDYYSESDGEEESAAGSNDAPAEVWPMESSAARNRDKKLLTRSDFWWLEDPLERHRQDTAS